jgi:hypothetical protein
MRPRRTDDGIDRIGDAGESVEATQASLDAGDPELDSH